MKIKIAAFMWRKCNKATLDSLLGFSSGQYHITLHSHDYKEFFKGLKPDKDTELGGFEITVPIEPFDGPDPIPKCNITVRYMGRDSRRKDWNIRSQRPETAYKLWRQGRGFLDRASVGENDYIVIARDINNNFHARWIRTDDFGALPELMKEAISAAIAGWRDINDKY
ncbi:hypothetical protein R5M92_04125 [Halomonas sp. Bachu 37]|uniref:hypothetical protein n=1 Tax=Halomonas kashgarensis TaxID=3084920 RepID=UPI00321699B8